MECVPRDLLCNICHQMLNEPRSLECIHSFCALCIFEMAKQSNFVGVTCPTCGSETQLDEIGIRGLLPDNDKKEEIIRFLLNLIYTISTLLFIIHFLVLFCKNLEFSLYRYQLSNEKLNENDLSCSNGPSKFPSNSSTISLFSLSSSTSPFNPKPNSYIPQNSSIFNDPVHQQENYQYQQQSQISEEQEQAQEHYYEQQEEAYENNEKTTHNNQHTHETLSQSNTDQSSMLTKQFNNIIFIKDLQVPEHVLFSFSNALKALYPQDSTISLQNGWIDLASYSRFSIPMEWNQWKNVSDSSVLSVEILEARGLCSDLSTSLDPYVVVSFFFFHFFGIFEKSLLLHANLYSGTNPFL